MGYVLLHMINSPGMIGKNCDTYYFGQPGRKDNFQASINYFVQLIVTQKDYIATCKLLAA